MSSGLKPLDVARYLVEVYTSSSGARPGGKKQPRTSSDSTASDESGWSSSSSTTSTPLAKGGSEASCTCPPAFVPLPLGERVFTDPGIDLQHGQHWLAEAFAMVTMAVYLNWVHILGILAVASLFNTTCMWITIGIWSTMLLPRGPCLSEAFLRNPVWRAWRRYFRFSVVFDGERIPLKGRKYVVAEVPHGVFPLGQLIATSLADMCWPGHPIYALAADAVFKVPLWRHVMTWLGGIPADAASFRRALQKGSVGLVPGGIAEMFLIDEDAEIVKLKDRKGFVRIAVEQGADLLPCFHFGNSRLFTFGPRWLEPHARRHRVALGLLYGRWGLPFGLPNHVPIMCVVGGPVVVRQLPRDHPEFAAAVDDAHARFVAAMAQLYDKYRGVYGWAERPLVIV